MPLQAGPPRDDDATLAGLYRRHVYTLLSFIRRYVSTREDAEDVLLEVFLAALTHDSLAHVSEGEQPQAIASPLPLLSLKSVSSCKTLREVRSFLLPASVHLHCQAPSSRRAF